MPPDPSTYWEAVNAEDERLRAVLAAISADQGAGLLTAREAADNRITALETHLAKCRALRRKYLQS